MDQTDRGFWKLRSQRLASRYECPSLIVSAEVDPVTKRRSIFGGYAPDGAALTEAAMLDILYPEPPRAKSAR